MFAPTTKTHLACCALLLVAACRESTGTIPARSATAAMLPAATIPPLDPDNIVSIALKSKDHTTLVAALKAANYVTSVANPGPLTVFAPTDAAFAKLPPGTVESLVIPARVDELKEILKYHVTTSVHTAAELADGQTLAMANGKKATIHRRDGKLYLNDAQVIASVRASNGIVHVVDGVLLPPGK